MNLANKKDVLGLYKVKISKIDVIESKNGNKIVTITLQTDENEIIKLAGFAATKRIKQITGSVMNFQYERFHELLCMFGHKNSRKDAVKIDVEKLNEHYQNVIGKYFWIMLYTHKSLNDEKQIITKVRIAMTFDSRGESSREKYFTDIDNDASFPQFHDLESRAELLTNDCTWDYMNRFGLDETLPDLNRINELKGGAK